jgi:hypothetical protein
MKISKKETYTIVSIEEETIKEFVKILENSKLDLNNEHLIIDISEKINTNIKEILLFLSLNNQHQQLGTSFVLIANSENIDEIPEDLNVVPTLIEAQDILEMEAIERDLGF